MARPGSDYPTPLELEIVKILWDESPLLVRDVRERPEASDKRTLAHSSVITMLNIMVRKATSAAANRGSRFLFPPK